MWPQVICHKAIQGSLSEVGCGAYIMCGKLRQLVCVYSVHLCFLSCPNGCSVLWSPSGCCGQACVRWISLLLVFDTWAGTIHFPNSTGAERAAREGDEV